MKKRILLVAIAAGIALSSKEDVFAANTPKDTFIGSDIENICEEVGEKRNICPELLEAIIETESAGVVTAKNGPCIGLMQVNQNFHTERMRRLGYYDLSDPRTNIETGADYLVELFDKYEDIGTVMMIYGGVQDAVERAERGDVTGYVSKILNRSEELERLHDK